MPIDLKQGYNDARSKIDSYKTTIDTKKNELKLKKESLGNNLEQRKSDAIKQLNEIKDTKQRLQENVKNQFDELVDLFKSSIPDRPETKSKTIDFLITQILGAAQSTKDRISEILIEEVMKTAGCSQEQTFEGNDEGSSQNKIYIRVNQIDLSGLLKRDPSEGFNKLLYENYSIQNGSSPFPMNLELFNRLQNEGIPFNEQYGSNYIGASGNKIMNIKYVTSYVNDGTTEFGDFYEITLTNRLTGNRISDFLMDYYKSIEILEFDSLSAKIMNSLTNAVDISAKLTTNEKAEQSKFEKIIQRILGICFDSNKEIDVSGNAKLSVLDNLDQSFFEMSPSDLRSIENEVNNMINGVTEFEDCGNIKLPVDVNSFMESINEVRRVPDNQKVSAFINEIEKQSNNSDWKSQLPSGIDIDLSFKNGLLKIVPKAVVVTILSPKVLLGLMIVLKSLGSVIMDKVEDFATFIENMKTFLINLVSKIGAIFVEELFKLLKKNIRILVETLMVEIIKESKNARLKMITTIVYILLQLANAALDWRECKSVVDEILNLLNLARGSLKLPLFALAGTPLLGGFSPTRAMANITENLQKMGIPTGDLPDGSPNIALPAIFQQIKGSNDEQLENSKTEIFIPPLSVIALGGGTTLPARGYGKSY